MLRCFTFIVKVREKLVKFNLIRMLSKI